jgi:hypothetical protein
MEANDAIGRTGEHFARVRQHESVKDAINVELSNRQFKRQQRHYSAMVRQPDLYPGIRDPSIVAPTRAETEAQVAREEVAKALARMTAYRTRPLGTTKERASERARKLLQAKVRGGGVKAWTAAAAVTVGSQAST